MFSGRIWGGEQTQNSGFASDEFGLRAKSTGTTTTSSMFAVTGAAGCNYVMTSEPNTKLADGRQTTARNAFVVIVDDVRSVLTSSKCGGARATELWWWWR